MHTNEQLLTAKVLKYLRPMGFKAGRYIYTKKQCLELIKMQASQHGIEDYDFVIVIQELKAAWQRLIS